MASPLLSSARRGFGKVWHVLDATRRAVFNLIFLAVVVIAVIAWIKSGPPPLAAKTALVFDLHGSIVEQKANPGPSLFNPTGSIDAQKVQLRDIRSGLAAAALDPKIERLVLVLDELDGAGLATLHEVAASIDLFKASGKPVTAWGSSYDQRQFYLAAHANEVLMHPFGSVFIKGMGGDRNYYRDALDRLGVTVNLIRVGAYKSAGEPYIANGPSDAAREADKSLYGALWADFTDDLEKARKLPAGAVMRIIDSLPQSLVAVGGDTAKFALTNKLVDGLKTRDQLRDLLIERGARDVENKTFRQISFDEYLGLQTPKHGGDAVGVVIAEGVIVDGTAPAGRIGGLSTAALIRKAREDEHIKAVVLRVDSPGGSPFGSELVRRELELTRAAGKPVVVSMGDVAASGGYWISMAADEVIADRSTVTGSIGVFALLPTAEQALDKLGVHVDGYTTTWLGSAGDPRRALDPRFGAIVQAAVDHDYAEFTGRAALARKTTPEKIDAVAQGRVWTGAQAKERNLVDRLGSYGDALQSAAGRAKLPVGYPVVYFEREQGKFSRLLSMFSGQIAALMGASVDHAVDGVFASAGLPAGIARDAARELVGLVGIADGKRPFTALAHCLCSAP